VTLLGWVQIVVFFAVVVAITPLLGAYMTRVYTGERVLLARVLGPFERVIYRLIRADVEREQDWKPYAASVLLFSLAGWLLLYLIRVRLVWRDLPGDGWSLHEYPASERVSSPVLLVQSVQRSAHFGAFWAAAAFNRWPRHDRLLKPSSTELGR
jgi:hypothetical protein